MVLSVRVTPELAEAFDALVVAHGSKSEALRSAVFSAAGRQDDELRRLRERCAALEHTLAVVEAALASAPGRGGG